MCFSYSLPHAQNWQKHKSVDVKGTLVLRRWRGVCVWGGRGMSSTLKLSFDCFQYRDKEYDGMTFFSFSPLKHF